MPELRCATWTIRVGFATVLTVLTVPAGCNQKMLNPPPTVATIGGQEAGRRLDHAPQPERIAALTDEIVGISPQIDPGEASDCASVAVRYTALLRQAYGLSGHGELNCLLVDLGLAPRGKCFELADDLNAQLRGREYRTLEFTRAICYWDKLFWEHNCVVLTARGQPFGEGLVLDPWRNPGVLRWARVSRDVYPWIPRIVTTRPASPSMGRKTTADTSG